jgi:cysteine desulfurase/selenocysteine lyase
MLRAYPKAKSIKEIRNCFPSLAYSELAYLDNAASTQTVDSSIKAVSDFHYNYRANVHRGDFETSSIASELYDQARIEIAKLINCEPFEIAFTKGTTHSLNIVANILADESRKVILTELEHHSSSMPWLRKGYKQKEGNLVVVPASDNGDVSLEDFTKAVMENPGSICAFLTQSNLTGMCLPWQQMIRVAKEHDCEVIIDACQSIGHKPVDVQANNIDWMAFSGHKMYASTGVGVLFHRGGFGDVEPNFDLGGGTAEHLDFDGFRLYSDFRKLEAGTPDIAGVHSIGAAAKWIQEIGYKDIQECEAEFFNMLDDKGLFKIKELKLIGPIAPRSVYSFVTEFNPSDLAGFLSFDKVCVRTGHMCAQPASRRYNKNNTGVFRVSSAPYNNELDCVKLVEGIWKAMEKLGYKSN